MSAGKITTLLLLAVLSAGFAASGAYALPDCAMGLSAAPMRMEEGCAGGSGCCGCEMETTPPQADFGQIPPAPPKFSPEAYSKYTEHSKNSLHLIEEDSPDDSREERPSDPGELYNLYSDYRI